jgi:energy-coupling factor transporter ATP-binding protein EcfA2
VLRFRWRRHQLADGIEHHRELLIRAGLQLIEPARKLLVRGQHHAQLHERPQANKLIAYLAANSRKLDAPLAVLVQSSSAAGKSTLMDAILALMPEEDRVKYSAMTGQSLFYIGAGNLKHKILAIAEEEGAAHASYALKLLHSEGELTMASTGKNPATGNLVTQESFGQLWSYQSEAWARRFFDNWRASLKWQRLAPYEKFAEMIDRHWDGIAAYCKPENKVSLGFVEGLNNKIRVIQRRAYGLRDEEYLRLKILTCMLPVL